MHSLLRPPAVCKAQAWRLISLVPSVCALRARAVQQRGRCCPAEATSGTGCASAGTAQQLHTLTQQATSFGAVVARNLVNTSDDKAPGGKSWRKEFADCMHIPEGELRCCNRDCRNPTAGIVGAHVIVLELADNTLHNCIVPLCRSCNNYRNHRTKGGFFLREAQFMPLPYGRNYQLADGLSTNDLSRSFADRFPDVSRPSRSASPLGPATASAAGQPRHGAAGGRSISQEGVQEFCSGKPIPVGHLASMA